MDPEFGKGGGLITDLCGNNWGGWSWRIHFPDDVFTHVSDIFKVPLFLSVFFSFSGITVSTVSWRLVMPWLFKHKVFKSLHGCWLSPEQCSRRPRYKVFYDLVSGTRNTTSSHYLIILAKQVMRADSELNYISHREEEKKEFMVIINLSQGQIPNSLIFLSYSTSQEFGIPE